MKEREREMPAVGMRCLSVCGEKRNTIEIDEWESVSNYWHDQKKKKTEYDLFRNRDRRLSNYLNKQTRRTQQQHSRVKKLIRKRKVKDDWVSKWEIIKMCVSVSGSLLCVCVFVSRRMRYSFMFPSSFVPSPCVRRPWSCLSLSHSLSVGCAFALMAPWPCCFFLRAVWLYRGEKKKRRGTSIFCLEQQRQKRVWWQTNEL